MNAPARDDAMMAIRRLEAMLGTPRDELIEEQLTHSVIGAFFEVYNTLGFVFLESLYILALEYELRLRGHRVDREVGVIVRYKGRALGRQRVDIIVDHKLVVVDIIVDGKLVVEVKATFDLHRNAPRQVYNYLRATRLEVGLLLHFGREPCFYRLISQA